MSIKDFINKNYYHFNAAVVKDAAKGYVDFLAKGNRMLVALGGAMSTAEIGITLAEMIRKDKVHAISCTGANLEEDIFNLVAHDHYKRVPGYRDLTPKDESELLRQGYNRVTDTCIPEDKAMRYIEKNVKKLWQQADAACESYFPYEYMYALIRNGMLKKHYQIDPKNSWVIAASKKNIPIYTPGWEDSTLGNVFTASIVKGEVSGPQVIRHGIEQMLDLIGWYRAVTKKSSVGFFQIGGGIAGDFPICVVPLIAQDLKKPVKLWGYFCQISDSTTSYGSYSGAVPNEKITWGKLGEKTPKYVIESDASIVAPLMFSYILNK